MITAFLRRGMYPLLMLAVGLGTYLLMRAGFDVETTTGICLGVVVPFVIALERVIPFRRDWNRSHGDLLTDAIHMGVTSLVVPPLYLGAQFLVVALAARVARGENLDLWPGDWPVPVQVALALLIAEAFTYAFHVLSHRVEFWWRFHATHHSVERLYFLNSARFHPVDGVLSYAMVVAPLALLGISEPALAFYSTFAAAHGLIQHANIDLRLGPLNWIVSGPELHRWHHARDPQDAMCNYGGTLIVWDHVFRTFVNPSDARAPERIGLGGLAFPADYLGQLFSPLRWRSLREPLAEQ